MKICFQYGALNDSLEKQANLQGYTLGEEEEKLEMFCTEILDLWINGFITDSQKDRAIEKLHKAVMQSLKKKKKKKNRRRGIKMTEQKLIDYFYTLFYDECCENFADVYDTKMFVENCLERAMREYCEAHGIAPD